MHLGHFTGFGFRGVHSAPQFGLGHFMNRILLVVVLSVKDEIGLGQDSSHPGRVPLFFSGHTSG